MILNIDGQLIMLWVIWDILVPLALAFLGGLFFGWLFWRWRRMKVSADELAAIRRSSARYKSDADTLRRRNAEFAEQLRTANGASESTTLQDLAAANSRIDSLREQLKQTSHELERERQTRKRPQSDKTQTLQGKAVLRGSVEGVRELKAQLAAARKRIQVLEDGTEKGLKFQAARDRLTDGGYFEEQIKVRDKLIATLQHSLEQYGEQRDTTALLAEIEIREERIATLENSLNDAQRVA